MAKVNKGKPPKMEKDAVGEEEKDTAGKRTVDFFYLSINIVARKVEWGHFTYFFISR
jgi:hypothetical protein